jgi:hypothetical protein
MRQALRDGERACQTIGSAKRIGKDSKAFDLQAIRQRENILRKIQQAAVRLKIGETHARTVHCNQAGIQRLQHLFVHIQGGFDPRTGRAVKVEERFSVRGPLLVVSKPAPIRQSDLLVESGHFSSPV